MFLSRRNVQITENPQRTEVPGIVDFINNTCRFYPEAQITSEEIYDKYVHYCQDHGIQPSKFSPFARSFKYFAFHNDMVSGLLYFPTNYYHDTPNRGIIRKSGWAYYNLVVNYR